MKKTPAHIFTGERILTARELWNNYHLKKWFPNHKTDLTVKAGKTLPLPNKPA